MTMTEQKSNIRLTKDTPCLALMGKLWGVFCEDFGEKKHHCDGIILYLQNQYQQKKHGKKCDKTLEKIFVKLTVMKRLNIKESSLVHCRLTGAKPLSEPMLD